MILWENELASTLSLAGEWEFSLGGQSGMIHVPGTWEASGYSRHTDGPATYTKSIEIPLSWAGKTVHLQFGAVSYYVQVSVNDINVGEHIGLWTYFGLDITHAIQAGETNTIQVSVYKPGETYPMRESLAGFLPDVATTFGGIWQTVRLVAFSDSAFSDIWLQTDSPNGLVAIKGKTHEAYNQTLNITVLAPDGSICSEWSSPVHAENFDTTLQIKCPIYWQPDNPSRYTLIFTLTTLDGEKTQVTRQFGFRTLTHNGEQLLLNNQPAFLRGLLNWGWYPEILCPAPNEATIRDEFRRVREFGYNMVKLCLYVPSPLYFQIADEEGMLLWLELPMWLPQVTTRMRQQAQLEYADILQAVHHHPSIVIYSLGCELGHSVDSELLGELDNLLRNCISDVLACDNSGSGEAYGGLSFDYADFNDYHFYSDLHYFTPLMDHFRRDWRASRPWIFGEFCDADDYRDLAPIAEYYAGELPWWYLEQNPIHNIKKLAYFEQQSRMATHDLPFDNATLQAISRKQSFVIRKAILEKVRSRSGMGGYVVTGLRDTPLATSAMFDDLGLAKYVSEEFRAFNLDTVLVIEQGRARLWTNGGDRPDPIDLFNRVSGELVDLRLIVSHAGAELTDIGVRWRISDADGTHIDNGETTIATLKPSHLPQHLCNITFKTPLVESAQTLTLEVELGDFCRNQWTFWVYPEVNWMESVTIYDPTGTLNGLDDLLEVASHLHDMTTFKQFDTVLITGIFDEHVKAYIQRGGRVLILQTGAGRLPTKPCPFWREAIKLIYSHRIMDDFPHDGYTDLQFYHLAGDHALDLEVFLQQIVDVVSVSPIIQRLDARLFNILEYLIEIGIGDGKLVISTLHFTNNSGDQTTGLHSNIAGRYLLNRLLSYLCFDKV